MTASFFSTAQLCKRYDVSDRTLINWRKKRGFPLPSIAGPKNLYSSESIQAWEHSQMTKTEGAH